ncbi:lasso peptide biosynthesis PqqD family chaperone [Streptomyces sp. CA-278952]|uniref:lasso peptide biosynthesis PqqD family chaperone n=1 Tax=Streptomyces sp. CA-278952 TaxID=2980556 RepID=UPI00236839D6|nr:lasso peptide biosynthesis PqqD family chaperone [Streptomyces sp. CA-278952]WDG32603.1 lasso peptide biosynthesis PqqD family chaperone [Streptomyces sp. CA-278952]
MTLNLARDVTLTPTDSGSVLLDGRRGVYWQLNASGSAILRRLLDGATPDATARLLAETVPVSEEQALTDVTAIIDALSIAKLVEVTQ